MSSKNWLNASVGAFRTPWFWSPLGTPQPGDILTILDGNPVAQSITISGFTIHLGGPNNTPGPGWYSISAPGIIEVAGAPNPTLSLISSTIASSTTIDVPDVPRFFGTTHTPYSATLLITGGDVNNGSPVQPLSENLGVIKTDGSWQTIGGTLYLSIANGVLENRGTIEADTGSKIVMTGRLIRPGNVGYGATMHNDGVINVYGQVIDTTVAIDGTGTIILGMAGQALGLPAGPSRFEFDASHSSTIQASQTVEFQGGQLDLVGDRVPHPYLGFQGMLAHFGYNPADLITLEDFSISAVSFSAGTLTLQGVSNTYGTAQDVALHFTDIKSGGHLAFSASNNATNISWLPTIIG